MKAIVSVCTGAGQEPFVVQADDMLPFLRIQFRDVTVDLTRDEARMVSDALRAAALTRGPEDIE